MWRNGLETIARIHQIDLASFDNAGIPSANPDASPVQHEIDKFEAMISDDIRHKITGTLADAVQYIHENAPKDGPRRLCWGDCRPGNIIWHDLKPNAVIDWEMASIGDPLADVAWRFWIDYVNSVGLGIERLSGLPAIEELYASWHELTGLPTTHSDFYDLFCVVRYAIILERKFAAMEAAGLGTVENFCLPFVEEQLARCAAQ
jgi:aminoglycoside phosphotransferase (APT) family kinase protein